VREQALALARSTTDPGQAVNRLREYLQAHVLRSLHECEAFRPLSVELVTPQSPSIDDPLPGLPEVTSGVRLDFAGIW